MIRHTPLLEIRSLCKSFPVQNRAWFRESSEKFSALHDISLCLEKGQTLGILGESGCGKTTLARCLMGVTPFDSGNVLLNGRDVSYNGPRAMKAWKQTIQLVYQDSFSAFDPKRSLRYSLHEALLVTGVKDRTQRQTAIHRLLSSLELEDDLLDHHPSELSGGQCQRLNIGRALLLNPQILILDEPTSALDTTAQKSILDLLIQLRKDKNLSYLFISHDLAAVYYFCDGLAVLKDGHLVESGKAKALLKNPQTGYTRQLVENSRPILRTSNS